MPNQSHGRRYEFAPYEVTEYIDLRRVGQQYLDARRFLAVRGHEGEPPRQEFRPETVASCWHKRFRHMGGRMAGGDAALTTVAVGLDMPYIRCVEEVPYIPGLCFAVRRAQENDRTEGPTDSIKQHEALLFPGRLSYSYALNRNHWAKEFYAEARLRSSRGQRGVMYSWHNVEFHSLTYSERNRLYWPRPDHWADDFEGGRRLAVPTPWVCSYATNLYLQSGEGSDLRASLDAIFWMEYRCLFALSHAQAALEGVFENALPDKRHDPTFPEPHGRLFRVPDGVARLFGDVHPFYFFESTQMDPVLCFLALRRALEYEWDSSSEACVYDFETGVATGMSAQSFRQKNRQGQWTTFNFPAFSPNSRPGISLTTLAQAQEAYTRFRELTQGHSGNTWRKQPCPEVTAVLNSEGHGLETLRLEDLRRHRNSSRRDETPKRSHQDAVLGLIEFREVVQQLERTEADGGLGSVRRGFCNHPSGTSAHRDLDSQEVLQPRVPREATPPPDRSPESPEFPDYDANPAYNGAEQYMGSPQESDRPDFWPSVEGMGETEEKFELFQQAVRHHVQGSFETLCTGLVFGAELAGRYSLLQERFARLQEDLRAEQRKVTAAESAQKVAEDRLAVRTETKDREISTLRDRIAAVEGTETPEDQVRSAQRARDRARRDLREANEAREDADTRATSILRSTRGLVAGLESSITDRMRTEVNSVLEEINKLGSSSTDAQVGDRRPREE